MQTQIQRCETCVLNIRPNNKTFASINLLKNSFKRQINWHTIQLRIRIHLSATHKYTNLLTCLCLTKDAQALKCDSNNHYITWHHTPHRLPHLYHTHTHTHTHTQREREREEREREREREREARYLNDTHINRNGFQKRRVVGFFIENWATVCFSEG